MKSSSKALLSCPCGSDEAYASCCQPHHLNRSAPSAELLMRSRYCAYVLGLNEYIEHTWHGSTRPNLAELGDESGATKWLGLTIEQAYPSSEQPNTEAFVQFTARYKVGGAGAVRMRELSRFVREQEQWYYIDGVFLDEGRTK